MPNATLVSPRNTSHAQLIDPGHGAARASIRPPGVFGSYSLSMTSGLVAAGMAGPLPIWEMRFWPNNVHALVRRLRLSAAAVTLFTAGAMTFDLSIAREFATLDLTGAAAAITMLGDSNARSSLFENSQLQSTVGSSAMQAFAILNNAATGLTAGAYDRDSNAIAGLTCGVPVTAGTGNTFICPPGTILLEPSEGGKQPVTLRANEGLILRALSVPATGTWTFTVDVDWDEVDPKIYYANFGG